MILVLTKADKLSKTKQKKQHQAAADRIGIDAGELLLFSAKTGLGRDPLWELIARAVDHPES
jgi:GTP-binding protein